MFSGKAKPSDEADKQWEPFWEPQAAGVDQKLM
jgi:hypothetical protein